MKKLTRSIWETASDIGPTQGKCRLFISSIFDAMNFQHFFGNAGNYVTVLPKNAGNSLHQKSQKLKDVGHKVSFVKQLIFETKFQF